MNTDIRPQIEQLHRIYVERTGFELRLDIARERSWYEFIGLGFTADDLQLVIDHLRRGIREQKRNTGALKFRNLIGMLDYFEEDLAEAKAHKRPPQPSTRVVRTPSPGAAGEASARDKSNPGRGEGGPQTHKGSFTERQMPSDGTEDRTRPAADVLANLDALKKAIE